MKSKSREKCNEEWYFWGRDLNFLNQQLIDNRRVSLILIDHIPRHVVRYDKSKPETLSRDKINRFLNLPQKYSSL